MINNVSRELAQQGLAHVVVAAEKWNTSRALDAYLKAPKTLKFNDCTITGSGTHMVFTSGDRVFTVTRISEDNFGIGFKSSGRKVGLTAGAFMDITDRLAGSRDVVLKYMASRMRYWAPKLEKQAREVKSSLSENIIEHGIYSGYEINTPSGLMLKTVAGVKGTVGARIEFDSSTGRYCAYHAEIPVTEWREDWRQCTYIPNASAGYEIKLASDVTASSENNTRCVITRVAQKIAKVLAAKRFRTLRDRTLRVHGQAWDCKQAPVYKLLGFPNQPAFCDSIKADSARHVADVLVVVAPAAAISDVTGGNAVYAPELDMLVVGVLDVDLSQPNRWKPLVPVLAHELEHAVANATKRFADNETYDSRVEDDFQRYLLSPEEITARIQELDLYCRKIFDEQASTIQTTFNILGKLKPSAQKQMLQHVKKLRAEITDALKTEADFDQWLQQRKFASKDVEALIAIARALKPSDAYERNALTIWREQKHDLWKSLRTSYQPVMKAGES